MHQAHVISVSKLLQGYAIIVSVQPSSTTALETATLTVAGQATSIPGATTTGAPNPEGTTVAPEPTTSVEAPVSTPKGLCFGLLSQPASR